jgi:hypothetical protein
MNHDTCQRRQSVKRDMEKERRALYAASDQLLGYILPGAVQNRSFERWTACHVYLSPLRMLLQWRFTFCCGSINVVVDT